MAKYADQENFNSRTFFATRAYGSTKVGLPPPNDEKNWDTFLDWCYRDAASNFPDDRYLIPQISQALPLVWNALEEVVAQPEARCEAINMLFDYAILA